MKYYIQDKLEELTEIAKNNPAVTVDFNHPSLVLFERISSGGHKSVIKLDDSMEIKGAAVRTFWRRLEAMPSFTSVINEFGDRCYLSSIKGLIAESYAMVRTEYSSLGTSFTETVGPIRNFTEPAPEPEVPPAIEQPATQPITDAV